MGYEAKQEFALEFMPDNLKYESKKICYNEFHIRLIPMSKRF